MKLFCAYYYLTKTPNRDDGCAVSVARSATRARRRRQQRATPALSETSACRATDGDTVLTDGWTKRAQVNESDSLIQNNPS